MVFAPRTDVFPASITELLIEHLGPLDADWRISRSPITSPLDVGQILSVTPVADSPDQQTWETSASRFSEPTMTNRVFSIAVACQHVDAGVGLGIVTAMGAAVNSLLVRGDALALELGALTSVYDGHTDRVLRWRHSGWRWLGGKLGARSMFNFMGLTDLTVVTTRD